MKTPMLEEIKEKYSKLYDQKGWRELNAPKMGLSERSLQVYINGLELPKKYRAMTLTSLKMELKKQIRDEERAMGMEVTTEEL